VLCRKRPYTTRQEANKAITKLTKAVKVSAKDFNIYYCKVCKTFHFGHSKKYIREQKKLRREKDIKGAT
jgi:hypothetical protein